jgi:hypothetical protein
MGKKCARAFVVCATMVAGTAAFGRVGEPSLSSGKPARLARAIPLRGSRGRAPGSFEYLFRGDMSPDLGLGCSNSSGTSGGPNDWATKVTATLTPPIPIISTTYNVFSFNSGPTWDFVAWENGVLPGVEIGRLPLGAANGTTGDHTAYLSPPIILPAGQQAFFFGLSQGNDTNGVRLGMDDSGSTPDTVFIRAPGCGAPAFNTVESLGFPGYWVDRVIALGVPPEKLMSFDVK